MIAGYSTLGAAALRIIKDYANGDMRSACRFTLDQAIEKVCFRKETVSAAGGYPSYVWWSFEMDKGDITVDIDIGHLAGVKLLKSDEWRYTPLNDADYDTIARVQSYGKLLDAMLVQGLVLGQRVLSRYTMDARVDYWGEDDSHEEVEVIYAEPGGNGYLPLPVDLIGQRNATKGISFL